MQQLTIVYMKRKESATSADCSQMHAVPHRHWMTDSSWLHTACHDLCLIKWVESLRVNTVKAQIINYVLDVTSRN